MILHRRSDWGADPSPASVADLSHGIIVHWNGPSMGNYSKVSVPQIIRNTYSYHVVGNGWSDIAYNFSIDRFGEVWEGRGANRRNAASGDTYANSSYTAVEFLCGDGDVITAEAKQALVDFYRDYVNNGGEPKILGHRNVVATACPGDELLSFLPTVHDLAFPKIKPIEIPVIPGEELMPSFILRHVASDTYVGFYPNGAFRKMVWSEVVMVTQVLKAAQVGNFDESSFAEIQKSL